MSERASERAGRPAACCLSSPPSFWRAPLGRVRARSLSSLASFGQRRPGELEPVRVGGEPAARSWQYYLWSAGQLGFVSLCSPAN